MASPRKETVEPFASFEEATQYLEQMCKVFKVRHLSYWSLSLLDGQPDHVTWIATYDPAYMHLYMSALTPLGDPAFEAGEGLIDWAEISADDETLRVMHGKAEKFGIGRLGLSYHFSDDDCSIMFSVNASCDEANWPAERERILTWYRAFAHHVHGRAKPLVDSRRTVPKKAVA